MVAVTAPTGSERASHPLRELMRLIRVLLVAVSSTSLTVGAQLIFADWLDGCPNQELLPLGRRWLAHQWIPAPGCQSDFFSCGCGIHCSVVFVGVMETCCSWPWLIKASGLIGRSLRQPIASGRKLLSNLRGTTAFQGLSSKMFLVSFLSKHPDSGRGDLFCPALANYW